MQISISISLSFKFGQYPFGMLAVGRNWESGSEYRYGFNTQEQDDEVYGNGNLNTAEFWEYDTRLGRRWNRDPIINPSISSYAVFENNPIILTDIKGDVVEIKGNKREKRKTERLINKAIKRDAEFAKIHQARIDDTENTYVYDWEKSNSASLNSQTATTAPAGKDQVVDDKDPNRFWVEFGTIDPEYRYYYIVVTQSFNQSIQVQYGTSQSKSNSFTTSIPGPNFSNWEALPGNNHNFNASCGSTCNSTTVIANISASSGDMYSKIPNGTGYEIVNSGFDEFTVRWVAMSYPILVKAPKGRFNSQVRKGNLSYHSATGNEIITSNRKREDGYYRVNIYSISPSIFK